MREKTRFRRLDGILLLDKPAGLSSNQALQRVRHLLRAEKAGHTGSLDPLATGLLPICFGEATKIAGLLLGARKAYATTARLGLTTDTDDADGLPLRERPVPAVDAAMLEAALAPLRGRITQRAPIYSALKQGGEPLYARARRGEAVQAPEREVEVHDLRAVAYDGTDIELHVECGSGTYVRSLVRDLGEALGCGAHVTRLRRLWVDPFRSPDMLGLDALHELSERPDALDARILPIEVGLAGFPSTTLPPEMARRFGHGQAVPLDTLGDGLRGGVTIVAKAEDGRLLGLASREGELLRPQRLFSWAAA
ncbi:tRNA pseudouridine(55) synthase TruB [Lysobacter humi (ex Lee et al. 2017)]